MISTPDYGKRLLPVELDRIVEENPSRAFASVPITSDVNDGFRELSFLEIANGVNGFAYLLEKMYGCSKNFETLTYIGMPDLRYVIVVLGAMKCGYKTLLPSPRNPIMVNLSLMDQTQSTKIFYSKEVSPIISGLQAGKANINCTAVGALDDMIQVVPKYAYNKTFDTAAADPVVVLHSSGSTGAPKPITMCHGTFAYLDNDHNRPLTPGRRHQDFTVYDMKGKLFHIFPPFHLAGFVSTILGPIFGKVSIVLGPPGVPPTGQLVTDILKHQKLKGLLVPPSVIEEIVQQPGSINSFKAFEWVSYAGGPLSQATGQLVSEVTTLCQFYGATEFIQLHILLPEKEDWAYIEFQPTANIELQPAEDDAFELVVFTDGTGRTPLDYHFPGISSYRTRDLFKPHPLKAGLWKFHGRVDDIIVLSNGEKFNPGPIELLLHGHPLVSGALVVGQGRFQAALLIEPNAGTDSAGLEQALWPLVQKSNSLVPGQGRISRDKIMFTKSDKPLPRAAKGTIIRKLGERLYEHEIQALYNETTSPKPEHISLKASFELGEVKKFVRSIIKSTRVAVSELTDEDDLYVHGLDSIGTLEISKLLRTGLQTYRSSEELSWIDVRAIYENPSIEKLAGILTTFLNFGTVHCRADVSSEISSLVKKYIPNIQPVAYDTKKVIDSSNIRVALVGATGNLGSHLLGALLGNSRFSLVNCLSRSSPSVESSKTKFLEVNYEKRQLGLTKLALQKVAEGSDILILNAWKTDFNQSLQSFENNLQSVHDLIEAVATSSNRARIVFISTAAAAARWGRIHVDGTRVPEEPLTEDYGNASIPIGYAESKLVAERILTQAAKLYQIPITILRVGQIAGSSKLDSKGLWPVHEWLPSTIRTSKALGLLPQLHNIDWIPVDQFSKACEEILLYQTTLGHLSQATYNVVNPQPVAWESLIEPFLKKYAPGTQLIPLSQWVEKVRARESLENHPIDIKVLDFLDYYNEISENSVLKFQTDNFTAASQQAASLGPITKELMEMWIKQWGF